MIWVRVIVMLAAAAAAALPALAGPEKPNIVILLVDDAALMDFGIYGGEARTPNIDALAARGTLFTQYLTSPLCAPSRAMLLTGIDSHRTGVATIPEVLPKEHAGKPGYAMALEPNVLTLAARLKPEGYRTFMTGKWHLGSGEGDLPDSHGFDRSFALDASGADNWADKAYMPYYQEAPWFEDGKPASLPENFYSSAFLVDQMIRYLDEAGPDAPVFAFIGFQAIHIPLQAPPEFIANYDGVYDSGWHALREARWQTAKATGLIPPDAGLSDMPDTLRRWETLPESEREIYAARMEVNAAMLEAMDFHIGRLIAHLGATGQLANTLFVITSDNGPEPSRGDDDPRLAAWMGLNGYHIDAEGLGGPGSFGFIGPEWAMAAASPGDLFKFYGAQGGLRVPLILAGPGIPEGARSEARTLVTDLAPTLLALAGAGEAPAGSVPMTGRSLLPHLSGETPAVYGPDDAIGIEVSGNAALFKGDYKITRNQLPFGDGQWRLYNITNDPGETTDLAAAEPERLAAMLAAYAAYAEANGVLEVPQGYDSVAQLTQNTMARQVRAYGWIPVTIAVVIAALAWFGIRRVRRRKRP